ncbi:MAG: hypothetical protein KAH14_09440 [Clostridiales bacterium]|nr:hypothetical protein [Clostridiales bacterium]
MWPQNLMFFIFPAIVIILIYFLLPFIGRKKEPFGYKTEEEISNDKFNKIKAIYYRKVFLFSIPLTIAISVANMYILSTFLGSFLLATFILTLGGINFLFYMHGYKAVKTILNKPIIIKTDDDEVTPRGKEELPKW